jgi:hypothetical protein
METELEKLEADALKLTPGEGAALAQRLLRVSKKMQKSRRPGRLKLSAESPKWKAGRLS